MTATAHQTKQTYRIINAVGAPWYEDLSKQLLDECLETGVYVVGATCCETWDGTVEAIENMQTVKELVRSHGRSYILETAADLTRAENRDKVGVVLGLQNPKPIQDSLHLLEAFADMGLRCCGLAFSQNSYLGGGYMAETDSGLTAFGKLAVETMNRRHIVIDLSHVGDKTAMDAIALSKHPVIFSHSTARTIVAQTGQSATRGSSEVRLRRAASDELIKASAAKGGVICSDARGGLTAAQFVEQLQYLVTLAGIDAVGVAAQDDWKRSHKDTRRIAPYLPIFANDLHERDWTTEDRAYRREGEQGPKLLYPENLAAEMKRRNFSDDDVHKVLGGNLERVFRTVLE